MERKEAIEVVKKNWPDSSFTMLREALETLVPELKESEDERIRKALIDWFSDKHVADDFRGIAWERIVAWLEKQGSEPNWCHHKVDLSNCSEEYCKAYYDGWNNCNMQHSQCKSELDDVIKCLINGMKFYYEDNEEATWGTDKWSMPVKHIIEVLEKQGEQEPVNLVAILNDYFANTPKEQQDKDWEEFKHLNNFGWKLVEQKPADEVGNYDHKEVLQTIINEQKPAWSEEDEKLVKNLISTLSNLYARNLIEKETKEKYTDLLKSLKDRVQPQNRWKPTEEQLKALYDSIPENVTEISEREMLLNELYKDLKYKL
jgi:hypothetical protein